MSSFSSLSIDLDNHWSYLKTHGDPSWAGFPSYLDRVVPLIREFATLLDVPLTAFVVGQDAELGENSGAMAQLGESGFEIANHSFHHEPWLHMKSRGEIEEEIGRAHVAIHRATGVEPRGFRGPGFSISRSTMHVLVDSGYTYDASTLPTFIGPLARAFYMRNSSLGREELEQRSKLFGGLSEVLRPIKPYQWEFDDREAELVEVPVTTIPLIRTPFHVTYLLYLARYSRALSRGYLRMALNLCRMTGVQPSLLLHSLDFIGADDVSDLEFFPGMDMSGAEKRDLLRSYVLLLKAHGEVVTVENHAHRALAANPGRHRVDSLA